MFSRRMELVVDVSLYVVGLAKIITALKIVLFRRRPKAMATHSSTLGKSHGRRSLVGCSPWGREESDMTE